MEGKSSKKNTQFSNKNTQYGKKDVCVTNVDVQQSTASTGPSKNDVEQCSAACAEPPKSKMESRSTEQESLIGYVQNLSPLKRNRKNTLDYASMTLQTASGNREVLLYSPPKRSLLLESEKSRRPIKLSCLTSTPDRKKLIINDMTKVSFPDSTEYSFQFEDVRLASPDPMTILQVLRWLEIVFSTYILIGRYNHSLSLDATVMVSKNCPITGEHVDIIFVTRQVTMATL